MPVLSKYFAIARDVAILAALAWIVHWIYTSGEDRVKVQDMAAVQQQIAANAKVEADNEARRAKADAQHDQDLLAIHALVAARNEPIIVRVPASPSPVPGNTGPAKGGDTKTGGGDAAAGGSTVACDVRPAISQYEEWVESALASCRSLRAQWPKRQ